VTDDAVEVLLSMPPSQPHHWVMVISDPEPSGWSIMPSPW